MKKEIKLGLLILSLSCMTYASASGYKNTPEYKDAYKCATDSFKEGYGSGPAAFCVGNSRDPSKIEEKAYKDAEKDFSTKSTSANGSCSFSYAVWVATGSHADDFLEGPQKETSLRQVIKLFPGREDSMQLFDKDGNKISDDVVNRLIIKSKEEYGFSYRLSSEAKKTCSKKQLG